VIGSAFADDLRGTTGANMLVSGAGGTLAAQEFLRGGSGADLLIGNGAGVRQLIGEGLADGGTAGTDTFRSLDGWNIIFGWTNGERIELDTATIARSIVTNSQITGTDQFYYRLDSSDTSETSRADNRTDPSQ